MKFIAALVLSALINFVSGCANQGISLASDDSQGELLALHEQWAAWSTAMAAGNSSRIKARALQPRDNAAA